MARWQGLVRWCKRVCLVLLPLLLVGLAYRSWEDWKAKADVQAAIGETEQIDSQWRWSDIVAKLPRLPDDQNSASVILKAHQLYQTAARAEDAQRQASDRPAIDRTEIENSLDRLSPQELPVPQQLTVLREECRLAEAAWVELQKVHSQRRGHYLFQFDKDILSQSLPYAGPCNAMNRLCKYQSILLLHDAKPLPAWRISHLALNIGRSLETEPLLIALMLRSHCWETAARIAEKVLAQTNELPEKELVELQQELQKELDQQALVYALRSERAAVFEFLGHVASGDLNSKMKDFNFPRWQLWLSIGANIRYSQAHYLRSMNQVISLLKDQERPDWAGLAAWNQEIQQGHLGAVDKHAFSYLHQPIIDRVASSVFQTRMRLRCAVATLAVERFRLRQGRWPNTWEELIPVYLPATPLDAYREGPLQFKRTEDGLFIFSVGQDKTDIGFRLWNPSARKPRTAQTEKEPQ